MEVGPQNLYTDKKFKTKYKSLKNRRKKLLTVLNKISYV